MKRFFAYLKTELKLSLRDMNMVIFVVIMPLIVFIIFGIVYGVKPAYDGRIIPPWNSPSEQLVRLLFAQVD